MNIQEMKRCKHPKWGNREDMYTPPFDGDFSGRGFSAETVRMLIFGITTITENCSSCNITRCITTPGQTAQAR